MRTAHRILREGAKLMRDHCAPTKYPRELDERADALENGINPFEHVPKAEKPLPKLIEEDDE